MAEASNPVSIFLHGKLFRDGWFSEEREWVDADEYRQLQRLHKQICDISADRHAEMERLTKIEKAAKALLLEAHDEGEYCVVAETAITNLEYALEVHGKPETNP